MENAEVFSLLRSGFLQWDYYVTMPMPASTFTIAVGQWLEAGVKHSNFEVEKMDKPYDKETRYLVMKNANVQKNKRYYIVQILLHCKNITLTLVTRQKVTTRIPEMLGRFLHLNKITTKIFSKHMIQYFIHNRK